MTRDLIRVWVAAIALFTAMAGTSCVHVGDSWIPGTSASASNNQIMLVRAEPESFGYQRLTGQIRSHPDLGIFVEQRGLPDFLAETHNKDRHYFILYYLKERAAYACRTPVRGGKTVEFAGPYPITDREYKVLDGFRKTSQQPPA